MSYYHEFPRFDFDIPHLEGFVDVSWHNNVSPSFERKLNDTESVTVWVDYLDPDRRRKSVPRHHSRNRRPRDFGCLPRD